MWVLISGKIFLRQKSVKKECKANKTSRIPAKITQSQIIEL